MGGRVHLTATGSGVSCSDNSISSALINGVECINLSDDDDASLDYFDWCRAHATGDRISISFHTR